MKKKVSKGVQEQFSNDQDKRGELFLGLIRILIKVNLIEKKLKKVVKYTSIECISLEHNDN